jgi:predicted trehalose synthase
MLRSFHYAVYTALFGQVAVPPGPPLGVNRAEQLSVEAHAEQAGSRLPLGGLRPEDREVLEPWARFWYLWVGATFLQAYLATVAPAAFLPASADEVAVLCEVFLLERAVYELGYELSYPRSSVGIPVRGILQLLETEA